MNKKRTWKLPILFLALFGAFIVSVSAQTPSPAPPDPILGHWRWHSTGKAARIIEFQADGRIAAKTGKTGVWAVVPSETTEREYKLTWADGVAVNFVILSADGNTIIGKSQTAKDTNVKGTRVDDAAAPGN